MRAIIIEEERFTEILDFMKMKCHEIADGASPIPEADQITWRKAVDAAHQAMHYYFVRWAQSHGASCTKR
jgi:hypothetical protein